MKLEQLANEYKKARAARNLASFENDLHQRDMKSDELTYWSEKLTEEMNATGTPIETVRAMING